MAGAGSSIQPPAGAPAAGEVSPPLVVWTGPVFDPSGYASALRGCVQAVVAAGVKTCLQEVRWSPIDAHLPRAQRAELEHLMHQPIPPGEQYIRVLQVFPTMFQRDANAALTIGRPYFETDRLPPDWALACGQVDQLWVASQFNLETFERSGIPRTKLRALPDCVDPERFGPAVPPSPPNTDRSFKFLSIFEWIPRKGWDILIRAFAEEFQPDEGVALSLQVYSTMGKTARSIQADIENLLAAAVGRRAIAPIILSVGVIEEDQIPSLYRGAQAYVQPSRGEGWGHPLMEAMASGLPTIGTRWSANLEFMNDSNSYLIDCRLQAVPKAVLSDQPYYGGHQWAEPSVEHLRALMRQVFTDRIGATQRGAFAAADMAERFSPLVVGRQYRQAAIEAGELARANARSSFPAVEVPGNSSAALPIPVVWEGGFFETHSMALVNRELALALLGTGQVDLSLRLLMLEPNRFDPREDPRTASLVDRVNRPLASQAKVTIRHAWPPRFEKPADGKWVMIQPWEFGSLPKSWVGPMRDEVDEVWAYSEAVRQTYIDSGVPAEKVHVVPLGVDPARFRPDAPALELGTTKSFRFLFVGGTIWRKGILLLLEAYWRAFRRQDDVCLVIKAMGHDTFYRGQDAADAIARVQADPNAPEILYLTEPLRDEQVPSLYTACHCLAHPYRGEGFGLPVAEAMACGLPAVVTKGGACDDFCRDDMVYWVPADRRVIQMAEEPAGVPWVLEPNVEALAAQLRYAYDAQAETAERGRRASAFIREHFTWNKAAERVLARLNALSYRASQRESVETGAGSVAQPATTEAWRHLARQQMELENWAGAEAALRQAVQLEPTVADAHYLLGCSQLNQEKAAGAVAAFQAAVQLAPNVAEAHNGLGAALKNLGRTKEALSALNRALELDPRNFEALVNLGELHITLGNYELAERLGERAQEVAPHDQQAHTLTVEARRGQGRTGPLSELKLTVNAPLFGMGGYESAARFLVGGALQAGIDVTLIPMWQNNARFVDD